MAQNIIQKSVFTQHYYVPVKLTFDFLNINHHHMSLLFNLIQLDMCENLLEFSRYGLWRVLQGLSNLHLQQQTLISSSLSPS